MFIEPNPKSGDGAERGAGLVDYGLSPVSANGEERAEPPRHYFGVKPALFAAATKVLGGASTNPVTSFNLNFEELLLQNILEEITWRFHQMIGVGLPAEELLATAIQHTKKMDNPRGLGTDGHLGYCNLLLGCGRRWQPYYEASDRWLFTSAIELINYDYGLSSPKDPARRRLINAVPYPHDSDDLKCLKRTIEKELKERRKRGALPDAASVLAVLRNIGGIQKVVRQPASIMVFPKHFYPFSLTGPIALPEYEDARLEESIRTSARNRKPRPAYQLDYNVGLEMRRQRHLLFFRPAHRTSVKHPALRRLWVARGSVGDAVEDALRKQIEPNQILFRPPCLEPNTRSPASLKTGTEEPTASPLATHRRVVAEQFPVRPSETVTSKAKKVERAAPPLAQSEMDRLAGECLAYATFLECGEYPLGYPKVEDLWRVRETGAMSFAPDYEAKIVAMIAMQVKLDPMEKGALDELLAAKNVTQIVYKRLVEKSRLSKPSREK